MLVNIFTSTLRTLSRHKRYTFLNVLGLALGISVFLTMALIVRYENSYDATVPHASQIFQIGEFFHPSGHETSENQAVSFVPFPFIKQDFPEIDAAIRVMQIPLVVRVGSKLAQEQVTMTDREFFSVFDLPLLAGDKATALDGPGKIVISAEIARKYFGTEEALGKKLRVDNSQSEAMVTGVLAPAPPNQTMQFDIVEVIPSNWFSKPAFTNWGSNWGTIWARIDNPQAVPRINQELARYPVLHPGNWSKEMIREVFGNGGMKLIPLPAVHFHNAAIGEGGNSLALVSILGFIGLAALATAVINYVNLATARSALRAREVAVRKVLGATRYNLIIQFMAEAFILVAFAAAFGVALTELSLHWVNTWGGWRLSLDWGFVLCTSIVVILLTGSLAGIYPALVISSYQPAAVLAASKTPAGGRVESTLRSVLVVLQFSFAMTLAICTLVMSNQAAYVRTLNRGMKQNGLIVISALNDASLATRQKEIVARLASVPGVKIATRSDIFPHHLLNNDDWTRVGQTQKHAMHWGKATPGYFDAIGARLIAGRFFDTQHGQDYVLSNRGAENGASIILSRLAAEQFGFSSPQDAIGQELREVGLPQTYRVIGVIDDIRFRGAKSRMAPLLYFGTSGPVPYVGALVRYSGASEHVEMDRLAKAWAEIAPDVAFSAESASDIFAEDYRSDATHSVLFGIGSAVAVGIACLGLYGLSAFNVSRRMQEIGIRKVLGAQTRDVLWLLVMQFLRPVMIASFVAWPAAYLLMQVWLAGFDERIALTPLPFIIVTLGALAIAVVTVLGQTLRAAIRSPAIALRQTI